MRGIIDFTRGGSVLVNEVMFWMIVGSRARLCYIELALFEALQPSLELAAKENRELDFEVQEFEGKATKILGIVGEIA